MLNNWKIQHSQDACSEQIDPPANLTQFLSKLGILEVKKKNQVYLKLYIEIKGGVINKFQILKNVDKRITLPNLKNLPFNYSHQANQQYRTKKCPSTGSLKPRIHI